jgi:hypothetical protein
MSQPPLLPTLKSVGEAENQEKPILGWWSLLDDEKSPTCHDRQAE